MPITVNVNGTLKTLTAVTANVSGTLKTLTEVQTNVSGTLKQIHCVLPSTISGTCSGSTGLMHKTTITATSCKVVGSLTLVSNALSSSGYTVSGPAILNAFKHGGSGAITIINKEPPFSTTNLTGTATLSEGTYSFAIATPYVSSHASTVTYSISFQ